MGVNVGGAAPHEARWFVVRVDVPIRPDEFFFFDLDCSLVFFSAISMKHALSCAGRSKKMLPKLRSLHEQMCCLSNLWFRTMNVPLFFFI